MATNRDKGSETDPRPISGSHIVRRIYSKLASICFLALGLLIAINILGSENDARCYSQRLKMPNFVFIMTDDQDLHLGSMKYMPAVQKHLIERGTSFGKHFCTVSLCCPSRVSLLTGKAAHNTNVTDVNMPYGGYPKFVAQSFNEHYLPVWLQKAGYNTYYTGKLMNQHDIRTYNQPFAAGWTRSDFLIDPGTYRYFDPLMSLDNRPYRKLTGYYSTDIIANRSLEFLGDALDDGKPFFLGIAPICPHAEMDGNGFEAPIPADRHKDLFLSARIPRSPNFNPTQAGDINYLRDLPRLNSDQIDYSDHFYRRRLQSLQAVDEMVDTLIKRLEEVPDVLANTYIFYTTDNGYHIGQHRLPPGKTSNFEEDINVPFVVRGPGVAAGQLSKFPTSHTDLVPTFFDLAGIPLHNNFDGVPIPLSAGKSKSTQARNEHVSIEFWGAGIVEGTEFDNLTRMLEKNTYKTVRVISDDYDFAYTVWCTNEHQLYDLKVDPYQLNNIYPSNGRSSGFKVSALVVRLDCLLLVLKDCKGRVCREPWRTVFPHDGVTSLSDAMNPEYDAFFMKQRKVSFTRCFQGYIPSYEGAFQPLIYSDSKSVFQARWEDWT